MPQSLVRLHHQAGAETISAFLKAAKVFTGAGMVLDVAEAESIEAVLSETESTFGAPAYFSEQRGYHP